MYATVHRYTIYIYMYNVYIYIYIVHTISYHRYMHRFIIVIFHHYSKWFHDHSHPLPYGPQLFAWLVSGGRGSHSIDPWQVPRSSRSSRAGNDSCRSHGVHCVLRALAGGTLQHNGGAVKQLDSWHGGSMVQSAVFIHNRLRVLCNSLCFCWTKILVMFGLRSWALGIQILLASSIHKPTLTTVESQPPKRYRKKYFFTTELENLPTSTVLGLPNTSFYAIDWGFPHRHRSSSPPCHAMRPPRPLRTPRPAPRPRRAALFQWSLQLVPCWQSRSDVRRTLGWFGAVGLGQNRLFLIITIWLGESTSMNHPILG